jgi:hypothetical protein
VLLASGAILTVVSLSLLGASAIPPSILSLVIAIALACWQLLQWWQTSRKANEL